MHHASGTPPKKAPGATRFQNPPASLQATPQAPSGKSVLSQSSQLFTVQPDDARVKNIHRLYTGTDIQMSIQAAHQQNLEVNIRINEAFEAGDGHDPEHPITGLALAMLAVEYGVTVRPGEQPVTLPGTGDPEVFDTAPFLKTLSP